MIITNGKAKPGNVIDAVTHMGQIMNEINQVETASSEEVMSTDK